MSQGIAQHRSCRSTLSSSAHQGFWEGSLCKSFGVGGRHGCLSVNLGTECSDRVSLAGANPAKTLCPLPPALKIISATHLLLREDLFMLSHCEVFPYSSTQSLQCICWHARSPRCPLLSRRGSSVSLRANVTRLQSACAYSSETSSASIARQQQGRHGLQETCRQPGHAKMVACLAAAVISVAGFAPAPAWAEKKEVRLRDVENPVLQSGKGSQQSCGTLHGNATAACCVKIAFQVQLCLEVLGLELARAAAAASPLLPVPCCE